jgi:hypothetical protein
VNCDYSELELFAVVADSFHWAAFFGFFAKGLFFRRRWLFIYEGITTVVTPSEIVWSCFAAQIAVDALIVDVEFAGHVVAVPIRNVCHKNCL